MVVTYIPKGSTALVANGEIHSPFAIATRLKNYATIIAVDGGLNHLHKMSIRPQRILGDLDSVDRTLLTTKYANIPFEHYPCTKDYTDLELALHAAWKKHEELLTVFGALGGRIDHTFYNLYLLLRHPGRLVYETEEERLFAVASPLTFPTTPGQTISLLPLGEQTTGVTTQGLRWNLQQATLSQSFMSQSNEALGNEVRLHVAKGRFICILQKNG